MRTISSKLAAVYAVANRARSVYAKVEVYIGSVWYDLSAITVAGRTVDFVKSVDYGESTDGNTADATVILSRSVFDTSLSPFCTSSRLNASATMLKIYYPIRISTATMPLGHTPASSDFAVVFTGRISNIQVDRAAITLKCRDYMGDLSDTFIAWERQYGVSTGTDVEDLIVDVLTNAAASTPKTLYSANGTSGTPFNAGDSPGWAISTITVNKLSIMDICKQMVDQICYSFRYRWHNGSGINDIVLVFEAPNRAVSSPDYTFTTADIYGYTGLSVDLQNIRNYVAVPYTDKSRCNHTVTAYDATSGTNYGVRWCEVTEGTTSQIDTETEAQAFANRLLLDMKDPTALLGVEMPYFFPVQLNDYYRFPADKELMDTTLDLAVQSIRHHVENGVGKTTLGCSGKPTSTYLSWYGKQRPELRNQAQSRNQSQGTFTSTLNSRFLSYGRN